MNLMDGKLNYPAVVLRALTLMLEASSKKRIQNPFGWTWACLHGKTEGINPWVQLITAREETQRFGPSRSPP
jgi:hypothetical protein